MNQPKKSVTHNVWVVVPALNEATRIAAVIRELKAVNANVVVVDDGSSDETAKVASEHGAKVLRHLLNRGQGAALQTGLEYATRQNADVIITFDADGQHDANDLADMAAPILRGDADVVLGSRFLSSSCTVGLPTTRRWILKAGVVFTRLTTGMRLTDTHNGIRAFSPDSAARINIVEDRMSHASDLLQQISDQKLRYIECPVSVRYSADSLAKGQSNSAAFGIFARLVLSKILQ